MCMHACVHMSHFKIKLYLSFIYEDILTKFAENVYGCGNMSPKKIGTRLKNNMAHISDRDLFHVSAIKDLLHIGQTDACF